MKGEGSSAGMKTVREDFSQERHLSGGQRLGGGKVYQAKRMARKKPGGNARVTYWRNRQGCDAEAQI